MDSKNKTVLAMFSLAFLALGGLQVANKYVNYSASSVLGEQVNIEISNGGKPNFSNCTSSSECKSGICNDSSKRCIPKSAELITPEPSTYKSGYIACSKLYSLVEENCNDNNTGNPEINQRGQVRCSTFARNILSLCPRLPSPSPTVVPTTAPVLGATTSCGVKSMTQDTKGCSAQEVKSISYTCSDNSTSKLELGLCMNLAKAKEIVERVCTSRCQN